MDQTSLNAQEVFRIIHDAVAHGAWWPLAGVALIFVVSAMRKLAIGRMGKVGSWLATDHGAMLLTVVSAVFCGLGMALLGGATPTKATVVGALMAGGTALVSFPTVQKFFASWFGVDLGISLGQKVAAVTMLASGAQKVRKDGVLTPAEIASFAEKTPTGKGPATPPAPPREGGFVHHSLLWLIAFVAAGIFFGISCGGCALSWPDIARVTTTSLNRAIVVGAELAEEDIAKCEANVNKLLDEGKLEEGKIRQLGCKKERGDFSTGLTSAKAVVTGAGAAVDGGEALGKKDYAGALAPVLQKASELVKLFESYKIQGLPPVEGVGVK